MQIDQTAIPGVIIITPKRFVDDRGFFSESWNRKTLLSAGIELPDFVQDNHSFSTTRGTVRGLHFQAPPHAQGKLVRCGRGAFLDVAVDIRKRSPTYGRWVAEELSFENGRQLWIPAGLLHGFVTVRPDCEIIYKCTDHYAPDCDGSVLWSSASLGIDWGIAVNEAVLSPKDAAAQDFADFDSPFRFEAQA